MRILLDEDVPIGLARHRIGHEAASVNRIGWKFRIRPRAHVIVSLRGPVESDV